MRNYYAIASLAVVCLLCTGCDFFRKIAGRPTSAEIEAKRELILEEEKAHEARLEALKLVQEQISDSLAVMDSIRYTKTRLIGGGQLSEDSGAGLEYRYYVIIGAFSSRENAAALAGKAEAAGYQAQLLSYRNGFTAVGLNPSNSVSGAYAALRKAVKEPFCPADAWILDKHR